MILIKQILYTLLCEYVVRVPIKETRRVRERELRT